MKDKRPIVVTVEKNGREMKWGPLSRASAWRAGSFCLESDREVTVLLEKDGTRKEVEVLKRLEGGRERVWFVEKNPQPPQHRPGEKDDESVTEEAGKESVTVDDPVTVDDSSMSEVDPKEMETSQRMWLSEKNHIS